jgi:GTP-binding protein HflX
MQSIQGNTDGIRRSQIERLESVFDMVTERKQFCSLEILETLASFSEVSSREAMVYIDRSGRVIAISIGEHDRVTLPQFRARRSDSRLNGIRCIQLL